MDPEDVQSLIALGGWIVAGIAAVWGFAVRTATKQDVRDVKTDMQETISKLPDHSSDLSTLQRDVGRIEGRIEALYDTGGVYIEREVGGDERED